MPHKIYRTLFFGTPDFAIPVLTTLSQINSINLVGVFTQPDKPVGRKQTLTPPPIKVAAENLHIPLFQPATVKGGAFKKQLRDLEPDVVVIIAYGKIIPELLLSVPTYGWVNIHASLLPKHRGASPIQAALLAGDTSTGVTLMQIDAGLDTGPMISQKKVSIESHETFATLHDKLSVAGAELIMESLLPYLTGETEVQVQKHDDATESGMITKEDGVIMWSDTAEIIDRHIRAYTPWPGAFTHWGTKRLLIHQATIADDQIAIPSGTTKRLGNMLLIGTGSSVMQLQSLQIEGKQKQTAAEFLRGYPDFSKAILS